MVVVVEENTSYSGVIGNSAAPYINNTLIADGASLTNMFALTHPREPNCIMPRFSSATNLASEALAGGKTQASYNENVPSQGSPVCTSGQYAHKHNPWFGFSNVPIPSTMTVNQFPTDFTNADQSATASDIVDIWN